MIEVLIRKTKEGSFREMTIKGHAEYAEAGHDIVCAAVSVLVINTLNSMEKLCGTDFPVFEQKEDDGYIHCIFKENMTSGETLLLSAMENGLLDIEKQYRKKYFRLTHEEV